ncbi:PREDICTED: uclacyanin-3-like [Camelina sativa]|uniref:Uclacyanin-3-like n=1 Tax=Camelina sativa TaxID=90675 RepID=A0ABM0WCR7_CAMSA|nr:PREDICTED: uclacyanin-3-like [Camelina sativa]
MRSITEAALILLLLAAVPAVCAVTFQVGDNAGWAGGVNYTTWVSGKTFRIGDTLEFKYGPSHSVSVVDKPDYDGCDSSRPTQSFSERDTKINLTRVGNIHFICPTFGHCLGGMKLAVPVLAAVSSAPSPSPSAPSPSPSPGNSKNAKNAASKRIMSYGKIGVTMVLMYGVIG